MWSTTGWGKLCIVIKLGLGSTSMLGLKLDRICPTCNDVDRVRKHMHSPLLTRFDSWYNIDNYCYSQPTTTRLSIFSSTWSGLTSHTEAIFPPPAMHLLPSLLALASFFTLTFAIPDGLEIENLTPDITCTRKTKSGDSINVHYRGTLASNGEQFDASYDRGQPLSFVVGTGRVIKGYVHTHVTVATLLAA